MFKKLFVVIFKILVGWIVSSFFLGIYLTSVTDANEAGEPVLSDGSTGLVVVFTLLITFGIPIWAVLSTVKNKRSDFSSKRIAKNRKKKLPPREQYLNGLFQKHKAHLVRNFNRTVIPNEYGAVDTKSIENWRNEVIRFLDSINLPEYLFKKINHYEDAIAYVSQLTINHIEELEEQNEASVNFENITDPNMYEIACAKELEIHGWCCCPM